MLGRGLNKHVIGKRFKVEPGAAKAIPAAASPAAPAASDRSHSRPSEDDDQDLDASARHGATVDGDVGLTSDQGDFDVFGHGGALDQDEGDQGDAAEHVDGGNANESVVGDSSCDIDGLEGHGESTVDTRCTLIRGINADDPSRELAKVWADSSSGTVRARRENGSEVVLCDMRNTMAAIRSGPYSAIAESINVKLVFTSVDAADSFLSAWGGADIPCNVCGGVMRAAVAKPRDKCGHPVCPGCRAEESHPQGIRAHHCGACASETSPNGASARAITNRSRWDVCDGASGRQGSYEGVEDGSADRGRRARARIEELRRRVEARRNVGGTVVGHDSADMGPVGVHPAPATPRAEAPPESAIADLGRVVDTGCGCRGRLHEACARRVKRRVEEANPPHDASNNVAEVDKEDAPPAIHSSARPRAPLHDRSRAASVTASHRVQDHNRHHSAREPEHVARNELNPQERHCKPERDGEERNQEELHRAGCEPELERRRVRELCAGYGHRCRSQFRQERGRVAFFRIIRRVSAIIGKPSGSIVEIMVVG